LVLLCTFVSLLFPPNLHVCLVNKSTMCEVASQEFNQGLGCNISYGPSAGVLDYTASPVSPKRSGFLGFRKNSPSPKIKSKKSKELKSSPKESSWSNIFAKKSDNKRMQEENDRTAELVAQMQLEGRSDADIAMHLQYITDMPAPASPSPKKNKTGISKLFKMIKDEFSLTEVAYTIDERAFQGMTVSISSAPFYGAPPPYMDMTFEELASLQPLYAGTKCVNYLPVTKHDGTPLPGDQTNCPVCLCEFTKGENLKSLPACVHFYHTECIDRWLMVGHSCPLCKTLVQ